MSMRAVDMHVHPPVTEWLHGSMAGYVEPAEAYFRTKLETRTLADIAREYADLNILAVLLAWDAQTATDRPPLSNEFVAGACQKYPEVFTGFGSVDPHRGEQAIVGVERIADLGLKGVKFHPSLQAFDPSDERHLPLFARCAELNLVALFHTGTSGIGANQPGGQGIRIDLSRPILLDPIAAAFPTLQIVAAHFGYPWHVELMAMALHKTNIWIDISGWAPRYIPPEVVREMKGRLQDRFLFGSDYPFISPERCLAELSRLKIPEPALQKIFKGNAERLLGLV